MHQRNLLLSTMPAGIKILIHFCLITVALSHSLNHNGHNDNKIPNSPHHFLQRPCPCSNLSLCHRIQNIPTKEIFVFSVNNKTWAHYDWNKITTVATFHGIDDPLMCHAHSKGSRIVGSSTIATSKLVNKTARAEWVTQIVQTVRDNFLDGINVDYEYEIFKNQTEIRDDLTKLLRELTTAVKELDPHLQVTVDFAWGPDGIDQRWYDYKSIADIVDFTFIMDYAERSQVLTGPCVAWANSPYNVTKYGLMKYLSMGIPPDKLVLGLPWNGMRYPCLKYNQYNHRCDIKRIPFRGVSCSDLAGQAIAYGPLVEQIIPKSKTGRLWNEDARTPYFMYEESSVVYQVWYDDPQSLSYKIDLAAELRLRGVGIWNGDMLDYTDQGQVNDMWGGLPGCR